MLVVAVAVAFGCKTSRAGYESAPYKVVRSDGKFELRDYPALTMVETPMVRGGNGADNGFMRLFRFITGSNKANQKIAMTTPVFMSGTGSNNTMAFVMPATMKVAEVPKPSDGSLTVKEQEPGRFAVLRFSGGRNTENEAKTLARLEDWIKAQGLKAQSTPIYGYFDPPWTPSFLRRNEVTLRIERNP
jgi:DNA gyrase inhibitor GyrI